MDIAPVVGNSDCGLIISDFMEKYPTAPLVVIHRQPERVRESLQNIGLEVPLLNLVAYADRLKELPGLHIQYDDINERLPEIHAHCVGTPFDPDWAREAIETVVKQNEIITDPVSVGIWGH